MSHFTVLVIGQNPEEQLAPFQENNMEDCPQEYLEFNDVEEEYRQKYETGSRQEFYCESSSSVGMELSAEYWERIAILQEGEKTILPVSKKMMGSFSYFKRNGKYRSYDPIEDDHPKKEMIRTVWFEVSDIISSNHPDPDVCFEGAVEITRIAHPREISHKEYYSDFETFIKDWAGYEKDPDTGKYGYWENPNAKWDWYSLGGRWTGYFKLKKVEKLLMSDTSFDEFGFSIHEISNFVRMYRQDLEKLEKFISKYGDKKSEILCKIKSLAEEKFAEGVTGKPGVMTDPAGKGYVDQAIIRNIDFDGMKQEAEEKARWRFGTLEKAFGGEIPKIDTSWEEFLDSDEYKDWDIGRKREAYHSQEALKRFKFLHDSLDEMDLTEKEKDLLRWLDLSDYKLPKEEYVKKAGNESFQTFAVIKDGKWYERGSMGWWGCVSDEKESGDWSSEFAKLVESLPGDTLLSVFDCHI